MRKDNSSIRKLGYEKYHPYKSVFAIITLIGFMISVASSYIGTIGDVTEISYLNGYEEHITVSTGPWYGLSWILEVLIMPLTAWVSVLMMRAYEGEKVEIGSFFDIFSKKNKYWNWFGLTFLKTLYTVLWTLLFIVPGIIKGLAYAMSVYVYRDKPDLGIDGAINESRRLMDGNKWRYFLCMLPPVLALIFGSIITLGIGALWLAPRLEFASVAFYHELIEEEQKLGIE